MKNIFLTTLFLLSFNMVFADCVYSAKEKTSFQILTTGWGAKIFFSGGYGTNFIIELSGSIYSIDELVILKDDFCSYESNVLYIDGEVYDVKSVTKVD